MYTPLTCATSSGTTPSPSTCRGHRSSSLSRPPGVNSKHSSSPEEPILRQRCFPHSSRRSPDLSPYFTASTEPNEDNPFIREQLASPTAEFRKSIRGAGRGRRGGRVGSSRSSQDFTKTIECYECGKVGHLRRNCPDLARNMNRDRDSSDHAGFDVAFVAGLFDDYEAIMPAHLEPSPASWVGFRVVDNIVRLHRPQAVVHGHRKRNRLDVKSREFEL